MITNRIPIALGIEKLTTESTVEEFTAIETAIAELKAECDGLFVIDVERLNEINDIDQVMIASRHTNTPVKKGDKLLGTRVIPLVIKREKMELVKEKVSKLWVMAGKWDADGEKENNFCNFICFN
mgnify:CR=1 FL=1